jgi:hypothetical protein
MNALALEWIVGRRVGLSSKAIWAHMMGAGEPVYGWSHPHDPDDLSRCIELLRTIPEWRIRLPEMAERSPEWSALVARWEEIVSSMENEVGWDWSKGRCAKKTYDLMRSIIDPTRT